MKQCQHTGCEQVIEDTDLWCHVHRDERVSGGWTHTPNVVPNIPPLTKEEIAGFSDPNEQTIIDENNKEVTVRSLRRRYLRETRPVGIFLDHNTSKFMHNHIIGSRH